MSFIFIIIKHKYFYEVKWNKLQEQTRCHSYCLTVISVTVKAASYHIAGNFGVRNWHIW